MTYDVVDFSLSFLTKLNHELQQEQLYFFFKVAEWLSLLLLELRV
jgi:hypothetical protein